MHEYGIAVGIFSHFVRKFHFKGTCRLHDLAYEKARLKTQLPSHFIHAARQQAWRMRKVTPQYLRWNHCLSTTDPKSWNIRTTHRKNPVLTLGLLRFAKGSQCRHMGYPIEQDRAWERYSEFIRDGWVKRACMVQHLDSKYMAKIWLAKKIEDMPTDRVIGIDAGLSRLAAATLYDPSTKHILKQIYIGQELFQKRMRVWSHRDYLRRKLKKGSVRVKPTWNRLKHYERNLVKWYCYDVAHQLVRMAKANQAAIALENLKGLRRQKRGKRMNRRLHAMPYGQLRIAIELVARRNGVRVVPVPPRNTSKTCPRCGLVSRRNRPRGRTLFRCVGCGYEANSDRVASLNIAKLGVAELLNKPMEREPLGSLQPNHCFEPTAPSQFSTGGVPIGVPDRSDEGASENGSGRI